MPKRARSVPSGKGGDNGVRRTVCPGGTRICSSRPGSASAGVGIRSEPIRTSCTPRAPGATLCRTSETDGHACRQDPARAGGDGEIAVADEAARRTDGGDRIDLDAEASQLRAQHAWQSHGQSAKDAREARALPGGADPPEPVGHLPVIALDPDRLAVAELEDARLAARHASRAARPGWMSGDQALKG